MRPTLRAANEAAAEAIAQLISTAVSDRGQAVIALSGGRTPAEMVRTLATIPLPWDRVHLFQVDERVVPADDPARNWSHLGLLAELVPVTHRHPMPVEDPDADSRYSEELCLSAGRPPLLDVVHLGLGEDGHTASLVPGDPVLDVVDQDVAWVGSYRGHRRLTLTLPVLARARHQVWLVTGSGKATSVRELAAAGYTSPGARAMRGAVATVFVDAGAATEA